MKIKPNGKSQTRNKFTLSIFLAVFIGLFHIPESRAEQGTSVGLQLGWSSVELDFVTDFGLVADIGLPWFLMYIPSQTHSFLIEAKLGYQLAINDVFKLRAGFRGDAVRSEPYDEHDHGHGGSSWWGLVTAEIGARIETKIGFICGIEFPLLVYHLGHDSDGIISPFSDGVFFLVFSQLYIGWAVRI